jgi:hypothetical protein
MHKITEHNEKASSSGLVVIGPDGYALTEKDLPPTSTKRWVIRRKAEVVAGVRAGLITLTEACERYSLSIDEFLSWQRQLDTHGLEGLKVTRIADFRPQHRSALSADKTDTDAIAAQ